MSTNSNNNNFSIDETNNMDTSNDVTQITSILSFNNKLCKTCCRYLPVKQFYKDSIKKDGLKCACIDCYNITRATKYSEAPHKYNNRNPVARKFCELCDYEIMATNYQKHLLGNRHQIKLKQLERIKQKSICN
jgi:hypothetical protein